MKFIPFCKPYITHDEIKEVVDSLKSGWITTGPRVKKFEEQFAQYIGAKHAVAVNSCTAAIHLGLIACGIGPGDEVITSPMTFVSTPHSILECGATPVLVDIDPVTMNMDTEQIESKITPRTKAILPVHIAGHPCDMDPILYLADKYDLYIIEDAAHALPAEYKGKRIGTIGAVTCFSFYATKNLCTAEGGMLTTDNDDIAEKVRLHTLHGISKDAYNRYTEGGSWRYDVKVRGYKYNMPDIMAAMGIHQLAKLESMDIMRREIVDYYNDAFKMEDTIETPYETEGCRSAWHLYIIKLNLETLSIGRDKFKEELTLRNIGTSVHFIPIYAFSYYQNMLGLNPEDFPVCESVFQRIISLPLFPGITKGQYQRVAEGVLDIALKYKKS